MLASHQAVSSAVIINGGEPSNVSRSLGTSLVATATRAVAGGSRAWVVADEDDVVELERAAPRVEVARLVGEAVRDVRLAGAPHPDQVGREAARLGEHVAPRVGGRGVAVQVDEGAAVGRFVVHGRVEDV